MEQMAENLRNIVGNRHPLLLAAAEQIFGAGGKKLRPAIVFLVARATADLMGARYPIYSERLSLNLRSPHFQTITIAQVIQALEVALSACQVQVN